MCRWSWVRVSPWAAFFSTDRVKDLFVVHLCCVVVLTRLIHENMKKVCDGKTTSWPRQTQSMNHDTYIQTGSKNNDDIAIRQWLWYRSTMGTQTVWGAIYKMCSGAVSSWCCHSVMEECCYHSIETSEGCGLWAGLQAKECLQMRSCVVASHLTPNVNAGRTGGGGRGKREREERKGGHILHSQRLSLQHHWRPPSNSCHLTQTTSLSN